MCWYPIHVVDFLLWSFELAGPEVRARSHDSIERSKLREWRLAVPFAVPLLSVNGHTYQSHGSGVWQIAMANVSEKTVTLFATEMKCIVIIGARSNSLGIM